MYNSKKAANKALADDKKNFLLVDVLMEDYDENDIDNELKRAEMMLDDCDRAYKWFVKTANFESES